MKIRVCLYEWCWLCNTGYTPYHFSNPLGCGGLQNGAKKEWTRWKRYSRRLLIILGLPFILLFYIPWWLSKELLKKGSDDYSLAAALLGPAIVFGFIVNVLVLPVLPFYLLWYGIRYCKARLRLRERYKSRLRQLRQRS